MINGNNAILILSKQFVFTIQRNQIDNRNPWLVKSCKRYFFFFGWATIAIDKELFIAEIICIRTNILIYLYMIIGKMLYFNFKFS